MKFIISRLLILLILALVAYSSAGQTVDEAIQRRNKCSADCRKMLKEGTDGTVCARAANIDPIPLIFQACNDGERSAFKQACAARCAGSAEKTVSFEKSSSYKACVKHKKGLRQHWCRRGYDTNRERLSTVVSSNIVEEESVKEADDEPALNHHHDISRALVQEVDRTMEKQLQRKEDTSQVASGEIIELGSTSTVPYQKSESELGLFHSQQTRSGVISSREEKRLQHGVVGFEAIAHCNVVYSELSLFDMLPRKSSEIVNPALPANSNSDVNAKTVEYTDFYTSGLGCYARRRRRRKINIDIILLTSLKEVSKDNADVWKYDSSFSTCIRFESTGCIPLRALSLRLTKTILGNILRAKTKVMEACTAVVHVVEISNTSHAHVVYSAENTLSTSLNYQGIELETTFRSWSLADNLSLGSLSITTRSDPDNIDPWQLPFQELLYHVWSVQVPFDEEVEEVLLDSPSQVIMSSAGIRYQSIHSFGPSRVNLLQVMSSYILKNVSFCPCVSDRDLLLDRCNLPPRLNAIFMTAVNCGVRSQSQSKQLCNPVDEELDALWIQEDAVHLELVFGNDISIHKKAIGGNDGISQSFSSCHLELTQYHCTWKALRRKDTEGCRLDYYAQPRGVFIICNDQIYLELCIPHLTPTLITYDSFTTSQVRLWKYPCRAKFKFKELNALHTITAPSSSKAVRVGNETTKGFEWSEFSIGYAFQIQTDYCKCVGFKHLVDPLMLDSSSIVMTPDADADAAVSRLQRSFEALSLGWSMHSRLKSVASLSILFLGISSECVISYQAGGSGNSDLDGDVHQARHPSSAEVIALALLLLVVYCCCRSGATRPLDSEIVDHGIIVEARREIVIEWKFQRRQELGCIALASIRTRWKDACKIQSATKALRSKLELSGLNSELGPYWNCSDHRGRSRRLQQPGRLKPP
eukprot:scaffold5653_cov95-Skeletonema_dohrnii-CCMP3373.AAC.3